MLSYLPPVPSASFSNELAVLIASLTARSPERLAALLTEAGEAYWAAAAEAKEAREGATTALGELEGVRREHAAAVSSHAADKAALEERLNGVAEFEQRLMERERVLAARESDLRRRTNDLDTRSAALASETERLEARRVDLDERLTLFRKAIGG